MAYTVHCGCGAPMGVHETEEAARRDYRDRQENHVSDRCLGWTGMLRDGQPFAYWGWESNDVWALCRKQLAAEGALEMLDEVQFVEMQQRVGNGTPLSLGQSQAALREILRLQAENERLRELLDAAATPCQCDPPGSGEEWCRGHCELRAEVKREQARAFALKVANHDLVSACRAARVQLAAMAEQIIDKPNNALARLVKQLDAAIQQGEE